MNAQNLPTQSPICPANTSEVIAIEFEGKKYGDPSVVVPLSEAWEYGITAFGRVSRALMRDESGREFWTFAKGWYVWDFAREVYHVARFGLGAYGDGGPLNPDAKVHGPIKMRLVDGAGWVSGINA